MELVSKGGRAVRVYSLDRMPILSNKKSVFGIIINDTVVNCWDEKDKHEVIFCFNQTWYSMPRSVVFGDERRKDASKWGCVVFNVVEQ